MRWALLVILVLVGSGAPGQPAGAQVPGLELRPPAGASAASPDAAPPATLFEKSREAAERWVRESVDVTAGALKGARDGVQQATGLSDDQLYGIGIGVLAGVAAADVLGTGGVGSLAVIGMGGVVGNWLATRDQRSR